VVRLEPDVAYYLLCVKEYLTVPVGLSETQWDRDDFDSIELWEERIPAIESQKVKSAANPGYSWNSAVLYQCDV